jgi:MSHA biogenesis protein MshQ
MFARILLGILIYISCFFTAYAEQCSTVFSDGVQNNNDTGVITFLYQASVSNSPDNILNSHNAFDDTSGGSSCDTGACSSSGYSGTAINYPTPPISNNDVTVLYAQTSTISAGNYNDIILHSSATLNLNAGDYNLSGILTVGSSSKINIIGSGVVRIFVTNKIEFDFEAKVNVDGDATNLLIYGNGKVALNANSVTSAFIYGTQDVELGYQTTVNGAISSGQNLKLGSSSIVNFIDETPNFGDFCGEEPTIHHFEVIHDGQGLTCEAESILIKACSDANCTSLYEGEIDVKLLVNGTVDKIVSIAGGSSVTNFSYTNSLIPATLSLEEGYTCQNSTSTSCDVIFSDTGFIIGNDSKSLPVIPVQLSGKPSDIGFNNKSLFLQAVKKDDNTGSCVGVFPENTDVAVNLSYTCHADSSACTNNLTLTNNSKDIPLTNSSAEHKLRFTNDSKAYFSLEYPDAGKIIINAQKNVEVEDSEGNKQIKDFSVSSNAFVVRPFGFQLDFSQDNNKDNALALPPANSAFKKAGETFKLTVTAKQWKPNQDDNNDGVPDNFADLSVNDVAGNFKNEQLTISHELFLPDPLTANLGTLTQETSESFTNSVVTNSYNFSEVGIIHLSAKLADGDYLDGGDIQGYIANVGRFTPAYFIQTVNSPGSLTAKHSSIGVCAIENWAYSGQKTENIGSLTYGLAPKILITAYNEQHDITENYTYTDFMKLSAAGIKIAVPNEDFDKERITPDVVGEKVQITSVMTLGLDPVVDNSDLSIEKSGQLLYQLNSADHFIYEHNLHSKHAPFPAQIPFLITEIEDTDGVSLYDDSDPNSSIISTTTVVTEGVEIRFGRWYIENSFGPETSPLTMPMAIQYWDNDKFKVNIDDNCTLPNIGTEVNTGEIWGGSLTEWQYRLLDASTHINEPIKTIDIAGVKVPDPLTSFIDGKYRKFIMEPPGKGKIGSLNIEYEVPSWLKYDWNDDGIFEENPSAKLTFGLFRGNDRIISQKEIYK